MSTTIAGFAALLNHYGYFVILVAAIFEGPIVSVLGGFFAAQGILSVGIVYLLLILGDLMGDLMWYGIGYYGAKHPRIYKWVSMNPDRVRAFTTTLRDNLGKTLIIAKYTQTGMVALPAAGLTRMPLGSFFWYNLLATLPKAALLMAVGYFFGYAFTGINLALRIGSLVLGSIVAIALFLYYRRYTAPEEPHA